MSSIDFCDFFAGWVGGAAGVISSHPLDTVKVRLQTSGSYKGTIDCIIKTFYREGLTGFYKGMSFPLLSIAAYNALVFGIYSNVSKLISKWRYNDPSHHSSYVDMGAAAMIAGGVSVLIGAPVDLIKIRLQSQVDLKNSATSRIQAKQNSVAIHGPLRLTPTNNNAMTSPSVRLTAAMATYRGPVGCIISIFRDDGVKGFFRGGPAMILRDIPGYVFYFLPYAFLCEAFRFKEDAQTGPLGLIMAGGLAGVLSWGIMHPVDTVKSRLQADPKKYKGVIDCIRESHRREGPSVFFRGLTINALRGFPQSAALFFGYEMTMRIAKA